jgi:hypothetical protein
MAFGAAGLAAAALTSAPSRENNNSGSDGTDNQSYGSFFVNQFVFGCTAGCYHSFKVTFTTTDEQFKCFGSPRDQDYVECKGDATSASYSAYIDTTTDANILKLQYTVSSYTGEGTTAHLYGKEQICAATSSDADKQKDYFSVSATSTTAIA